LLTNLAMAFVAAYSIIPTFFGTWSPAEEVAILILATALVLAALLVALLHIYLKNLSKRLKEIEDQEEEEG